MSSRISQLARPLRRSITARPRSFRNPAVFGSWSCARALTAPSLSSLLGYLARAQKALFPGMAEPTPPPSASPDPAPGTGPAPGPAREKLHGRPFYESIGSPRLVVAPMVDQSEFAWRMLCRSFLPAATKDLLAVTPMFHARLFSSNQKTRDTHFRPLRNGLLKKPAPTSAPYAGHGAHLDGNPSLDRPLIVQFCANDPDELLAAARHVQPFCDAVEINLGCPQGIARKGRYGSFLQDDWATIRSLIARLHAQLDVPVVAKFRILGDKARTLEYARMLLDAGAAWLTLHARRREQKGQVTGLADWSYIRHLRDNLPPETVIFANGNILEHADIADCVAATGADGVMSAEGCLASPAIFAGPQAESPADPAFDPHLYWFPREGDGKRDGYRLDAMVRRYLDVTYKYIFEVDPPVRKPLYVPDRLRPVSKKTERAESTEAPEEAAADERRPTKRQRQSEAAEESATGPAAEEPSPVAAAEPAAPARPSNPKLKGPLKPAQDPSLRAMQPHLFALLPRRIFTLHPRIRTILSGCRAGNMDSFEHFSDELAAVVEEGMRAYENGEADVFGEWPEEEGEVKMVRNDKGEEVPDRVEINKRAARVRGTHRAQRPWWVCQPHVREEKKDAGGKEVAKEEGKEEENGCECSQ